MTNRLQRVLMRMSVGVAGCLLLGVSAAQTTGPTSSGLPGMRQANTTSTPMESFSAIAGQQNPFFGGVPSGAVVPGVLQLSVKDAVQRGLKYNLGLLLSEDQAQTARGARWKALSDLLPNLSLGVRESAQQINLLAFGITPPAGTSAVVGPFGVFDARAFLTQPVLDIHALQRVRQESQNLQAASWNYRNARELVVLVVGGSYLQALAGAARRDAVEAQFNTAQALYQQAVDLKKAGVIAGIDVLRAQVEMQAQQQRLVSAGNDYEKQKLSLARVIGLPAAQQFELSDKVPFAPAPEVTPEAALEAAYRNRADYQAALSLARAAEAGRKAAQGEALPSLEFTGDYGTLGPRPTDSHGTFSAVAALRVPVFQGGKVRGDVLQAEALLKRRQSELDDLRGRVEFEVRTALLDLRAASEQVQVARSTMDLAQEQLKQAQDRFAAGVANNIDVVQAQESLATAQENYISSLNVFNFARLSLARATGSAQEAIRRFAGGTP